MALKNYLAPAIIATSVFAVIGSGLAIGTKIAYDYESIIDVTMTTSSYRAADDEKTVCRNVVEEGAVLLHNQGGLPLKSNERKVAFLGQDSVDFVYGGSGSGSVDTSTAPTLKTAFEEAGFTVNKTLWDFYATGAGKNYRKTTPDEAGHGTFAVNEVPQSLYTTEIKNAMTDDFAVVCIGRSGGESADLPLTALSSGKRYLQLDPEEEALLRLACEKYNKVILIYNGNNAFELGFLNKAEFANVQAAFWVGGVGQEGLHALPRLFTGVANPSGRLVDTFAYDSTSAPSFANMGNFTISNSNVTNGNKYLVYGEGIYVGYRYYETRYEDVVLGRTQNWDYASAVQYPFGYGLSYTSFEYSGYKVEDKSDRFLVSLAVKNVGDVEGKEVVQIYTQKPYSTGGVEVASVELAGYAKTKLLKKGESQTVQVEVLKKDLASYDDKNAKTYVLGQGDYYLAAGRNAHDALNNILASKGKSTADGMTSNGDASLSKKAMTLASIDTDSASKSVTGKTITNRLEDIDVNHYESYDYLSRADWTGTFPKTFKNGSWQAPASLLEDLEFYDVHNDVTDDEAINAFVWKTESTDTSLKAADLIGVSYDDPRFDQIIDQLKWGQMTRLIRLGGYSTIQIDAIGLPKTQDKDGPSGISGTLTGGTSTMSWPAEVVMAATWNESLIEELGTWFGKDAIQIGVAGVYGPGADIHRSPYSGRNFEYFSEDPHLSYHIVAAELKGLRKMGEITYTKHFALNDQETNRYGSAIFASEQAVREIYLKGFEGAVVEGKTNALMTAMNRVGSRWVGAHRGMMTDILRQEWGFKGMAITDQASVPAMFYQDMKSGLWAGTDLWLNTNGDYWKLDDVKDDKTMQYYIHRAAKNIVYAITNSWAVDESFRSAGDGEMVVTDARTFPWRQTLTAIDVVLIGGTFAWAALSWFFYAKHKRKGNVTVR